jgi:hypothetical protein
MGWTAPSTYSTGQIVNAAILNTDVRDNLRYLKGLDGNVGIGPAVFTPTKLLHLHDTALTGATLKLTSAAPGIEFQDNVVDASRTMYGALGFGTAAGHFGGGAGDMNFATAAYAGGQTNGVRFSTARDTSGNYASRLFVPGGYASGAGRVGINTDAPQGNLHLTGVGGGAGVFLEYNGVDATLRTLLSAATITAVAAIMYAVKSSSGGTTTGITNTIPGGQTDYADGSGSTLRIAVTAGGALTLQRVVSGTSTFKVALWVVYI